MRSKRFLIGLLLLLVGACASTGLGSPGAASGRGVADTMRDAITTYNALEPRLSAAQKEEFKDAYNHVCSAYQTAGTLLTSVFDAYDEASAHTALVSYQTTVEQLPILADKVSQLVRSFKGGAK